MAESIATGKALMPRLDYARSNDFIAGVSDSSWLSIRGAQLDWNRTGPVTQLRADLQVALEQYLTPVELKEIISDERTDGQAYLTLAMSLYQTWYAQLLIRQLAPAAIGQLDSGAVTTEDLWVTDSWNHLTAELSKILIPAGLAELTRALNPVIRTCYPQLVRKYRGGVALLWAPHMTAAEAWSNIGTLKTYAEAGNYLAKCKVKLSKWAAPGPLYADGLSMNSTPYGYAMGSIHCLMRRDNGNAGIYHLSEGESMVGSLIADANLLTAVYTSATWYESMPMVTSPGDNFSDMYALLRYMGTYDATHNTRGLMQQFNDACLGTTMAANKAYAAKIAHDGTTFTIMDDDDLQIFIGTGIGGMTTHSGNLDCTKDVGGVELVINLYKRMLCNGEYATPSSSWINDKEILFFEKMLRGGGYEFGFTRSASPGPRSSGSFGGKSRGGGKRSGKGRNRKYRRESDREEAPR